MRIPHRHKLPLAVLVAILASGVAWGRLARAEAPSPADVARAGAAFEEGVARFGRAEYAEAARAFFRADELAPSTTAITNAISSARRANDHLLVARAAERAIARKVAEVQARDALADAATRLSRIDLRCDASPCAVLVDGAPAPSRYVLPGTHVLRAEGPAGATAEERLSCVAGANYEVTLYPTAALAKSTRAAVITTEAPAAAKMAPAKGLHRAVFFSGLGATAILGGVTVWSGIDAINARSNLPARPFQAQNADVLARARRSDFLLLGTGLTGVATAVVGLFFTDWSKPPVTAALVPVPGGAVVSAQGSF